MRIICYRTVRSATPGRLLGIWASNLIDHLRVHFVAAFESLPYMIWPRMAVPSQVGFEESLVGASSERNTTEWCVELGFLCALKTYMQLSCALPLTDCFHARILRMLAKNFCRVSHVITKITKISIRARSKAHASGSSTTTHSEDGATRILPLCYGLRPVLAVGSQCYRGP